ncbi:MAG: SPOR domain-containing protein [Ramlibacter sp.]|nr:SPOR domain-containing protein [Ramlibacter sp.]
MPFFKSRKGGDESAATPRQPESVEAMRMRARHRLIGAGVLVLIGVIGFPLLFDTQPRPIAVDIPIEIPDRNKARPLPVPAQAAAPSAAQKPAAAAPATPAPAAEKAAVVAPKPEPKTEPAAESRSAAGDGRFVVQVGAFADAGKAREARQKLERAGLKTYTNVAETKDGKRIRVRAGPFASRAEADKAADKIKSLNLQASILSL